MIRVFNLITDQVQLYDHDDPVAAVVTSHCAEMGMMSWLTSFVMEPPEKNPRHNPEAFPELMHDFTRGRMSICCGDWATLVKP